ncbi:MAG: hypothetical protein ABEJ55_08010 [Halanaeroarchaeum sp.]
MDLWDDDRGQSIQVGAILLFAILIISLASYQTTVVPNENRQAEFDHSLALEEDLLEVRNAIMEAYQDGEAPPVSVKLGMTYPQHTFGVNPAPVSGTLRTTESAPITISDANGPVTTCPSQTRLLNYSASYDFYEPAPTLVYENTVLYADYGEDREVVLSDESLIVGDTVNLVALQGDYSENGLRAVAFQARAGPLSTTSLEAPSTIEVPTRLSASKWRQLIGDEVDSLNVVDGTLTMNFTRSVTVRCSAVGADAVPPGGDRPDGTDGGDGSNINPPELRLESTSRNGNTVTMTFNNTGATTNFTSGRINFFQADNNNPPSEADVAGPSGGSITNLQIGGELETATTPIEISGGSTAIDVSFYNNNNKEYNSLQNDWLVITFYDENGEQYQYFVGV